MTQTPPFNGKDISTKKTTLLIGRIYAHKEDSIRMIISRIKNQWIKKRPSNTASEKGLQRKTQHKGVLHYATTHNKEVLYYTTTQNKGCCKTPQLKTRSVALCHTF